MLGKTKDTKTYFAEQKTSLLPFQDTLTFQDQGTKEPRTSLLSLPGAHQSPSISAKQRYLWSLGNTPKWMPHSWGCDACFHLLTETRQVLEDTQAWTGTR